MEIRVLNIRKTEQNTKISITMDEKIAQRHEGIYVIIESRFVKNS